MAADYVLRMEDHMPIRASDHQSWLPGLKQLAQMTCITIKMWKQHSFHLTHLSKLLNNCMIKEQLTHTLHHVDSRVSKYFGKGKDMEEQADWVDATKFSTCLSRQVLNKLGCPPENQLVHRQLLMFVWVGSDQELSTTDQTRICRLTVLRSGPTRTWHWVDCSYSNTTAWL